MGQSCHLIDDLFHLLFVGGGFLWQKKKKHFIPCQKKPTFEFNYIGKGDRKKESENKREKVSDTEGRWKWVLLVVR